MSLLKYINSLVLVTMLSMPFQQYCFNMNKMNEYQNHEISLKCEKEDSTKNRKKVKLRPEKEVHNIINVNNVENL